MPFTLSHPVAAAPIWYASRGRLPLPALVIGAMSPDFEYLFRLAPRGDFGHGVFGMVVFSVPLTLVATFVFESVMREPMSRLLGLPERFAIGPERTVAWWSSAVVAAFLGASSHALWDSVTHGDGWIAGGIPELQRQIAGRMRWVGLLQQLSTILGAAGIAFWLSSSRSVRRAARTVLGDRERMWTLLVLFALAWLAALANGFRAGIHDPNGLPRFLAYAAVGGMDGLVVASLGYSLLRRLPTPVRRPSTPPVSEPDTERARRAGGARS